MLLARRLFAVPRFSTTFGYPELRAVKVHDGNPVAVLRYHRDVNRMFDQLRDGLAHYTG